MILVDSDVFIDALRGREPSRSKIADGLEEGTLVTTTVTAFELLSGARSTKQAERIDALLAPLELLPFDEDASRAAAGARRELEARGETIGMGDYLIAGICLSRALPLLTRNRNRFDRVPGLLLVDH
ncbi:MAG: type II toxin-antitoxin system VapC family toxin [bacterium]